MTISTSLQIQTGSPQDRAAVEEWLREGLVRLPKTLQERVVTAWVSTWRSGPYVDLQDVPGNRVAKSYRLTDHVLEVLRCGTALAAFAEVEWGLKVDEDNLVSVLLLHDVDKPIILERRGDDVVFSKLGGRIPHGVLGALILRDLDFPDVVVHTVATHSVLSPFHPDYPEAWILYYADYFPIDYELLRSGQTANYQHMKPEVGKPA